MVMKKLILILLIIGCTPIKSFVITGKRWVNKELQCEYTYGDRADQGSTRNYYSFYDSCHKYDIGDIIR